MGDTTANRRTGRPRSEEAHRAILDAARELLIADGYDSLRLEHVAIRAKVGKSTIYRRWSSKAELAEALLEDLATPAVSVPETDDTRSELHAIVLNTITALTTTSFGPVILALLSQIAINPALGDPFRSTVVRARRDQVTAVVARGIERGDLAATTDANSATEVLIGPIYYRLIFGEKLNRQFADRIVTVFLDGNRTAHASHPGCTVQFE
jgi:AcrR family transcriptional regulator